MTDNNGCIWDELNAYGKYAEFLKYSKEHSTRDGLQQLAPPYLRLAALLAYRHSIFRTFYVSLWLTVGLMAGSVAVLALTPVLGARPPAADAAFVVGSIWFVGCLISYAALVRKALS